VSVFPKCAGFELTHRRKVTPSSMWRPNSTQATRKNPVNSIGSWVGACPNYQFLPAAAGLITADSLTMLSIQGHSD